ncbi:hypothetical protein [Acetivibrio ethanolgignens]|uniref:Uncharacterized protein n=1 Tax=Acetivibrio ethanolgignens TaxID=290052 RepID=A0A0V8QFG3_9FIRM|nr:hypothetical protein [Acetivibrio ethanolgignens]KSV59150.1 hypothetical protein ASU35_10355 [Acetivibrio ethanolgignens]
MSEVLRTVVTFGYVVNAPDPVLMWCPLRPFNADVIKLCTHSNLKFLSTDLYLTRKLVCCELKVNEDNVLVDSNFTEPDKILESKQLVAILAGGKALCDDGKVYKIWYDQLYGVEPPSDEIGRLLAAGVTVQVWVYDGVVYGVHLQMYDAVENDEYSRGCQEVLTTYLTRQRNTLKLNGTIKQF